MTTTYQRTWETRGERRRAGRSAGEAARESYYGIPPIHQPHWKWLIILYLFLGGISSGSYVVASIAEVFGGEYNRRISRAGRYLSFLTLIPCPLFLILDLGRPERFHHMLRIVKLSSPMSVGTSVGTWGLTLFGALCTLSAMMQAARDGLIGRAALPARLFGALPARLIDALALGPGFFVGGYTGVLLAATAVPLWTKNYLLLGPLFLTSALSNATAAIALVLSSMKGTSHHTLDRPERLGRIALLGELALLLAMRANLGPTIARPMEEGRLGRLHRYGVLGTDLAGPLALLAANALLGARASRFVIAVASLLVLAGGVALRYVMVMAGRHSADQPEATFELARRNGQLPHEQAAAAPPSPAMPASATAQA